MFWPEHYQQDTNSTGTSNKLLVWKISELNQIQCQNRNAGRLFVAGSWLRSTPNIYEIFYSNLYFYLGKKCIRKLKPKTRKARSCFWNTNLFHWNDCIVLCSLAPQINSLGCHRLWTKRWGMVLLSKIHRFPYFCKSCTILYVFLGCCSFSRTVRSVKEMKCETEGTN